MTRDEILSRLQTWLIAHDHLDKKWDAMGAAFGVGMAETPLWEATWGMFQSYTSTLGDLLGDPGGDWLNWFCYENDMGGKGYPAGYDGHLRPIETLGDLADLILEGRRRA